MGGTKIFVVQLREVLKSSVFIIIGIVLLVMLIFFFIPKDDVQKPSAVEPQHSAITATFVPGTYSTEILLHNSPVKVNVTVTESEIVSVEFSDKAKLSDTLYPLFTDAMDKIAGEVVKYQSAEGIINKDNTVTNQVLLDAVKVSLQKAVARA